MKKKYMTPQTEVIENVIDVDLCQAAASQDPGSGGSEGSEELARDVEDNDNYSVYPMWEE